MPTTYAHYRFGRDVLELLPEEQRAAAEARRHLFNFGVHGPDLLFYYKPLWKNPVSQKGYASHSRTGRNFFTEAIEAVRSAQDRAAATAYLYGVVCHFTLDRECHPYVAVKERDGVSHNGIEASFDRYLMVRDGIDPANFKTTGHLAPSPESAAVIAPFYAPLTAAEVHKAEKSMVFFLDLLASRGFKRKFLLTAAKLTGQQGLAELFIKHPANPACRDSDVRLYRLYEGAIPLAAELIAQADACLRGEGELGPAFDHTFGAE